MAKIEPTVFKFRMRPGCTLWRSQDDAELARRGGRAAASVRPWAAPGEVVKLTPRDLAPFQLDQRKLGMFEPLDAVTRAAYGHIPPTIPAGLAEQESLPAGEGGYTWNPETVPTMDDQLRKAQRGLRQ